jgi:hypothetical protein
MSVDGGVTPGWYVTPVASTLLMLVNEPELVGGVILVPDAAAPVVAARMKVPVEANASASVTCTPDTVIDPSGL